MSGLAPVEYANFNEEVQQRAGRRSVCHVELRSRDQRIWFASTKGRGKRPGIMHGVNVGYVFRNVFSEKPNRLNFIHRAPFYFM